MRLRKLSTALQYLLQFDDLTLSLDVIVIVWSVRRSTVGKGVSGETVKRSDDGPSVVSYAEAVKGKQYVIE